MRTLIVLTAFILMSSAVMYQAVRVDGLVTGSGTDADPLSIDTTTYIATQYDISGFAGTAGKSTATGIFTTDTFDWNPSGFDDAEILKIQADWDRLFKGMAAGDDWERKTIVNTGNAFIITPEHSDATDTCRFMYPKDFRVQARQSVDVLYDPDTARWRIVSSERETFEGKQFHWYPGSGTAGDTDNWVVATGSGGGSYITKSNSGGAMRQFYGSAVGAYAYMYFGKTVIQSMGFGWGHTTFECYTVNTAIHDATNDYECHIQITGTPNTSTAVPNNTLGVRASYTENSGNWTMYVKDNSGTETTLDTGIPNLQSNGYHIVLQVGRRHSEFRVYINDVFAGAINTGDDSDLTSLVYASPRAFWKKTIGTTARYWRFFNASFIQKPL